MDNWMKAVLADFRPVDRVLIYMMKAKELIELAKLMTDEDMRLLKSLVQKSENEPK